MSKFNANMDDFFSGEEQQQTAPAPKKIGRIKKTTTHLQ